MVVLDVEAVAARQTIHIEVRSWTRGAYQFVHDRADPCEFRANVPARGQLPLQPAESLNTETSFEQIERSLHVGRDIGHLKMLGKQ